jgi:hypothetical protein
MNAPPLGLPRLYHPYAGVSEPVLVLPLGGAQIASGLRAQIA